MNVGDLRHKIKNKVGVITKWCQPMRCIYCTVFILMGENALPWSELEVLCK